MEQVTIRVKNREKARLLLDLLRSLDFVEVVEFTSDLEEKSAHDDAFFALAGLWADREITQDNLRQSAWPRQSQ
jgi:hypothetical protein